MMCNRFNFIHASLVSAKKLNTHPLPVKNDHHSMNSCLLGCLINDYTCTLRGYLAKQKFFGTKNTKQIPLFTTRVFLSPVYRRRNPMKGSLNVFANFVLRTFCVTKCLTGHLRIAKFKELSH